MNPFVVERDTYEVNIIQHLMVCILCMYVWILLTQYLVYYNNWCALYFIFYSNTVVHATDAYWPMYLKLFLINFFSAFLKINFSSFQHHSQSRCRKQKIEREKKFQAVIKSNNVVAHFCGVTFMTIVQKVMRSKCSHDTS